MKYLIAYDFDEQNPNPHEWRAFPMVFGNFAEAEFAAEREQEREAKEYDGDFTRWIVISLDD